MKFINRIRVASDILRGKITDSNRIVTNAIDINHSSIGIFGGLGIDKGQENTFQDVSIKDLENEPLETLLPKIIKSDPAIDQVTNFFTTLVTQKHNITAESSRGERALTEILQMLEMKKNPLSLTVSHCASSLIMRGDICIETEFNENNKPENLWVPDPKWVEWRLISDRNGTRWALGQYKKLNWEEITSPNVYYLSGDPLIGERSSRSPLQTALFPAIAQSSMIKSLQSIIDVHAWAQTVFVVKKLEMIKLEAEGANIEDINAQVLEAMQLITNKLGKKKHDEIMGVTDDIEPLQIPGGGKELTFTKEIGQLYDKRVASGSKTPTTVGGPSERADYSTKEQGLFYSAYLQSSQDNIKEVIEWSFTRFFRSMGITDDPIYTSKSINVQARMIEAQAFQEVMNGVEAAVKAGMPLPLALDFFEEESGQTFSADLKAKIEKSLSVSENVNDDDDDDNDDDDEAQDNNYLASAIVSFLKKNKKNKLKG